jgi:mRNA-degrading endonuclease RelE of RelBE toxin-antitoxin system
MPRKRRPRSRSPSKRKRRSTTTSGRSGPVRLAFRSSFHRAYRKIKEKATRDSVDKALRRFWENPRYQSLRLERLGGSNYWSIRASGSFRILLEKTTDDEGSTLWVVVDAGEHDVYRRT